MADNIEKNINPNDETDPTLQHPAGAEDHHDDPEGQGGKETMEEELARLRIEVARNKTALDKALKEKGDVTKKYRDVLTEAQQAKLDKEAQDEAQKQYVASLEAFKKTAEAKARYALQGMNEDLAVKAAEAEIAGDMDLLATIQQQHTEILIKQKETEWLKSRPQANAGSGGSNGEEDPFLKGFNSVSNKYITK
jgi:phenylalanyl-tRNA synthetase alpha subunit